MWGISGRGLMCSLAVIQCARLIWAVYQRRAVIRFLPRDGAPPDRSFPRVSVIIPARNEAPVIGACLEGARRQEYPHLQIVVVDDQSEDETGAIAEAAARADERITVCHGAPLPPGWKGKCWALHQGTQVAAGDWLLFVDTDTRLLPGAVAGAVAAALSYNVPALSVLTAQELPTWWEKLIQPAVIGAISEGMPLTLANNPRLPAFAIANGQFILVRRDVYDRVGGHEAIKGAIAEDAELARRLKRQGYRLLLGDGRRLATTRMYASPARLWEGWTKNLHISARLLGWLVAPATAYLALALVAPFICFRLAWLRRSRPDALAGAVQLAVSLAMRRLMDSLLGVPWPYTLAQPAGDAVFLALLLTSFYRVFSGRGVTWKGRRYDG